MAQKKICNVKDDTGVGMRMTLPNAVNTANSADKIRSFVCFIVSPHILYHILSLMTKETILTHLGEHPWADKLTFLPTVNSTNTYAKAHLLHGACVIADHQTAGRGRLGRSFASPKGQGLYLSVVLKTPPSSLLTPMAAEAVRRAIQKETGLCPSIKWVNDLVCNGRKLCGILTEISAEFAIIGIGLNCRGIPHEVATSMEAEGTACDRSRLAAAIIMEISKLWNKTHWLADYKRHCLTIGQDVQLIQNDTIRYGHVNDMDDTGALLVTLPDGTNERIFSGEVSIRGLYGYV